MRVAHIRSKLILASLAAIIPFIAWNGTVQYLRYRESRDAAIDAQREVARSVAHSCADYAKDLVELGRSSGLAVLLSTNGNTEHASQTLARTASVSRKFRAMIVTNDRGTVIASSTPGLVGRSLTNTRPVRRIMGGRDWAIGNWSSLGMGAGTIGVASAIRGPSGRLRGVAVALFDSRYVQMSLPMSVMGGHDIVVTDDRGRVILAYGRASAMPAGMWARSALIRSALRGKPAVTEAFIGPHGGPMLGASEPIPSTGWATAVFTSLDETIAPLNRMAALRLGVILLATLLAIILAISLGNHIAGPLLTLVDAARSLAHGDLSARARVRSGDEIELLSDSFNDMAGTLEQGVNELNEAVHEERRQKQRASELYTIAQKIVITVSLSDRLEAIAQSLASLCGVKRCAILLMRGGRFVPGAGWGLLHPERFDTFARSLWEAGVLSAATEGRSTPIYAPDIASQSYIDEEVASELMIEGYLAIPLVRRGHLVGLAILDTPGRPPTFDEDAIDDARGLADLAAIAIENAEGFEKQHNIAQSLQSNMLTPVPDAVGSYHIASGYYAALEVAELGGDFYDYVQLPDGRLGFVIADVSGKGLEAAMYTAMGKYTLRAFMSEDPDPGCVLTRANRALSTSGEEWGFVTMFYGLLDPATSTLLYANAGHPPVLLVDPDGTITRLPSDGRRPPLGALSGVDYPTYECRISPGTLLVCYTDGVIEARQQTDQYDIERLETLVSQTRRMSPADIIRAIHESVIEYSGGRPQDDIALLAIKRDLV